VEKNSVSSNCQEEPRGRFGLRKMKMLGVHISGINTNIYFVLLNVSTYIKN
jgi:hypothetical protein